MGPSDSIEKHLHEISNLITMTHPLLAGKETLFFARRLLVLLWPLAPRPRAALAKDLFAARTGFYEALPVSSLFCASLPQTERKGKAMLQISPLVGLTWGLPE